MPFRPTMTNSASGLPISYTDNMFRMRLPLLLSMCAHPGSLGLQMVRYQLNCRAALSGIEGTGDIANEVSSYSSGVST